MSSALAALLADIEKALAEISSDTARRKALAAYIGYLTRDGALMVEMMLTILEGKEINGQKPSPKHRLQAAKSLSSYWFLMTRSHVARLCAMLPRLIKNP